MNPTKSAKLNKELNMFIKSPHNHKEVKLELTLTEGDAFAYRIVHILLKYGLDDYNQNEIDHDVFRIGLNAIDEQTRAKLNINLKEKEKEKEAKDAVQPEGD